MPAATVPARRFPPAGRFPTGRFSTGPLSTGRAKVLALAVVCPLLTGCNVFMIAAYQIAGPPSVEPGLRGRHPLPA